MRWLDVDLGLLERGGAAALRPFDAALDGALWAEDPLERAAARIGAWSGSALALALAARAVARGRPLPFVVAVPSGVRRALPTAARAVVAGASALSGGYAEALVGSDLALRLASAADALCITGQTSLPGAVLAIGADTVALESSPELAGAPATDVHAALAARWGACASLAIGPAGEARVAFASLAAGGSPPHFVGRGLGAAFAASGLKALVVFAPAAREGQGALPAAEAEELRRALLRSPRLAARADGGTLELYAAFAAGGELRAADGSAVPLEHAERVGRALRAEAGERHGCRGCPTPCGWSFTPGAQGQGRPIGARFGATEAFAAVAGLDDVGAALELIAQCGRLGLDAKEAAAVLALGLGSSAGGAPRSGPAGLSEASACLDEIARASTPRGRALGAGAERAAAALGRASEVTSARGAWVRPRSDRAALLGVLVSPRGADPARAFAFTSFGAAGADVGRLVAPLALPPGALDPALPAGKGRLVWWHENLANALDLAGFCSFSAAGLLADGIVGLPELARWIAPPALRAAASFERAPERALLAAGAVLAGLQRALEDRLALGQPAPERDRPAWARAELDEAGMLDEYRALRGVGVDGRPTQRALEELGDVEAAELASGGVLGPVRAERTAPRATGPRELGRARVQMLRAPGAGAVSEGEHETELEVELELPATVSEVLAECARRRPSWAPLLLREGRPVPAVFAGGRALASGDLVMAGDRLDLLFAIAGG